MNSGWVIWEVQKILHVALFLVHLLLSGLVDRFWKGWVSHILPGLIDHVVI